MQHIQAQFCRVTSILAQVQVATVPAEKALVHVVERLHRAAVSTTISLLPKPLELSVRGALRGIDLAVSLARGLGRDGGRDLRLGR